MTTLREMLKSMRIENPRTNGDIICNAAIDDALAEPWRRAIKFLLVMIAVVSLCVIAYKM